MYSYDRTAASIQPLVIDKDRVRRWITTLFRRNIDTMIIFPGKSDRHITVRANFTDGNHGHYEIELLLGWNGDQYEIKPRIRGIRPPHD